MGSKASGGGGLVTKLCPTLASPGTVAHQAPLSMGFPRQEYWSGLPFPSQGTFLTQESNPGLLHHRQILYQLGYVGFSSCDSWGLERGLSKPVLMLCFQSFLAGVNGPIALQLLCPQCQVSGSLLPGQLPPVQLGRVPRHFWVTEDGFEICQLQLM